MKAWLTVPPYAAVGDWTIVRLRAYDNAGNVRLLTRDDLLARNFPDKITVTAATAASDTTAPNITGIRIRNPIIPVFTQPQELYFEVSVTDDISGVYIVEAWFDGPTGLGISGSGSITATGWITGGPKNGTMLAFIIFPPFAAVGDWVMTRLRATDSALNNLDLSQTQIATRGLSAKFIVSASRTPVLEKWAEPSFPVVWRVNPAGGPNITGSRTFAEVVRSSFQTWSGLTTSTVRFAEGQTTNATNAALDGINLIAVASVPFGSAAPALTFVHSFGEPGTDQLGRVIQFPGQILEADILLNPAVEFSTELVTPPNKLDLQSVIAHEIGHLLGLDHSGLVSAVMSPTLFPGKARHALTNDDVIRVSMLYPSADLSTKGTARGVVRNSTGLPVFGAHVVIVNSTGQPVASTITDPDGVYGVRGLEPGNYSAYAEVLDGPLASTDMPSLARIYPGATPAGNFTTRFAVQSSPSAQFTLTKTGGGDNQAANVGQALSAPLEVQVKDSSGSPVAGVSVSFAATGGGGTVVPIRAVTDAQGKARSQAYLGSGALQTFTASVPTATVTFTAMLRQ